jgi:hypothetical protein
MATTFAQVARHKERTGVIAPDALVRRVKVDNGKKSQIFNQN